MAFQHRLSHGELWDRHEALKELDGQNLEKEIASLSSDKELEEELARLKREMGQA